jgi:hypothetical protein
LSLLDREITMREKQIDYIYIFSLLYILAR